MRLQIVWAPAAADNYDRLPLRGRERIHLALYRLAVFGRGDVTRLNNPNPPEYRLRVGEHRLRFALFSEELLVLYLGHRSSV